MNDPRAVGIEFLAVDTISRFRPRCLQAPDWGLFDGRDGLLIGDIGSVSPALIAAVTILRVRAPRMAGSDAASVDVRQRTLRSFAFGHCRPERNDRRCSCCIGRRR